MIKGSWLSGFGVKGSDLEKALVTAAVIAVPTILVVIGFRLYGRKRVTKSRPVLLLFHQAFGKGLNVMGADSGWGFWLVVAIFGLIHGVTVQGGELAVNLWAIVGTGFIGFVLTWMRERTGSLVIPIAFHNISNVAQAFI